MGAAEREKHLRIVAEILLVHLPNVLKDQALAKDLLSVLSVALRAAWEDAMKSAEVWDTRHYHLRADQLRDEWTWALAAANTAEGLVERDAPVTREHLDPIAAADPSSSGTAWHGPSSATWKPSAALLRRTANANAAPDAKPRTDL